MKAQRKDNPSSIFYWKDYENDESLRISSLAAQGLWMRLLCIAAKADPYGYILVNGFHLEATGAARLAGVTEGEAQSLLQELERNGVFSRDRKGRMFSRRMVRDAALRAKAQKNGAKGGNPALGVSAGKQKVKDGLVNPPDNQHLKPPYPLPHSQEEKREEIGKPISRQTENHDACIDHFNAVAARVGWAQVQKITPTRKAALSHRITDCGGQEAWRDAIDRAAASPLLTGQTGRGWRADFDWLCKAANFTKLMEGNYDPRPDHITPAHQRGPGGAHDSMVAAFAGVARRQ